MNLPAKYFVSTTPCQLSYNIGDQLCYIPHPISHSLFSITKNEIDYRSALQKGLIWHICLQMSTYTKLMISWQMNGTVLRMR